MTQFENDVLNRLYIIASQNESRDRAIMDLVSETSKHNQELRITLQSLANRINYVIEMQEALSGQIALMKQGPVSLNAVPVASQYCPKPIFPDTVPNVTKTNPIIGHQPVNIKMVSPHGGTASMNVPPYNISTAPAPAIYAEMLKANEELRKTLARDIASIRADLNRVMLAQSNTPIKVELPISVPKPTSTTKRGRKPKAKKGE